jgi:hypothetical protein
MLIESPSDLAIIQETLGGIIDPLGVNALCDVLPKGTDVLAVVGQGRTILQFRSLGGENLLYSTYNRCSITWNKGAQRPHIPDRADERMIGDAVPLLWKC